MRNRVISGRLRTLGLLAICTATSVRGAETIFLNFSGDAKGVTTPLRDGANNLVSLGPFDVAKMFAGVNGAALVAPGLTANQDIENDILSDVQADYNAFAASLNFTATAPANGPFETVTIGDTTTPTTAFGQAYAIDWRNKTFADPSPTLDSVGVNVNAHAINGGQYSANGGVAFINYNDTTLARVLANTVSHEVGHTLGLVHSDVVSTYAAAGGGAAGQTAVQADELMTKNPNATNFYAQNLSFGTYSNVKLHVATVGVNLENEAGQVDFSYPGAADPVARAGDAGSTAATATTLVADPYGYVSAIGSLSGAGGADPSDMWKFFAVKGEQVFGEVLSQRLVADPKIGDVAGASSLITNPISPQLQLIGTDGTTVLTNNDSQGLGANDDPTSNLDGSGKNNVEGDALIYGYAVPATGYYYWNVSNTGAASGQYELFTVPEPASVAMIVISAIGLMGRRSNRRRIA